MALTLQRRTGQWLDNQALIADAGPEARFASRQGPAFSVYANDP
jgi:hypothetical protein